MKTRKQKETGEKEVHLLEQKGYEKMVNEIVPVQQVLPALPMSDSACLPISP